MTPVEKALWLTEAASAEELTLEVFAKTTGLSRFQIARAFRSTTGVPLMAYVRARRLTEAARRLQAGEPDILMVALAAGYGSHAAFTRAFSGHFGITPEEMRAGAPFTPHLMERIVMTDDVYEMPTPVMRSKDAFRVAGLARVYPMGPAGDIPALWQEFNAHMSELNGAYPAAAYGMCFDQEDGESFEYLAAADLPAGSHVPEPLVTRDIPALDYAVFTHKGHVSDIHKLFRGVYETWLPESGKSHGAGPDIEFYDHRFNPTTLTGEVELWIPVTS